MRPEEKERLHEDDRFIKFMKAVGRTVGARHHLFVWVLLTVIVGGAATAIYFGTREASLRARLTAMEEAKTIEQMQAVAEEYGDDAVLLLRLADAYTARGGENDLTQAEAVLERAVLAAAKDIERSTAQFFLAKVKLELGKTEEALGLFDQVAAMPVAQTLFRDESLWQAGRCLELLGRPDDAEERYSGAAGGVSSWAELARFRLTQLDRDR